jgi:HPt (histidine-containing phosphotransfer) domain-containing protein
MKILEPDLPRIEPTEFQRSTPIKLDVSFADVRRSFLDRLRGEQARLAFLAAALETAGMHNVSAFIDLEVFAHRLRGAAAVFELHELRDESKALELAASAATTRYSPDTRLQVGEAIRKLADRLIYLNQGLADASVTADLDSDRHRDD